MEIIWVVIAFALGLVANAVGLPPLLGEDLLFTRQIGLNPVLYGLLLR